MNQQNVFALPVVLFCSACIAPSGAGAIDLQDDTALGVALFNIESLKDIRNIHVSSVLLKCNRQLPHKFYVEVCINEFCILVFMSLIISEAVKRNECPCRCANIGQSL